MNLNRLSILFLTIILFACSQTTEKKKDISDVILNEPDSYFYIDTKTYPTGDKSLPVGVFDSGTGGLTVLDAIVNFDKFDNASFEYKETGDKQRDFLKEKFIYLGDMANMPYGQYSSHNKTDLLKEHIIKDVQFLLGNKYYKAKGAKEYSADKSPIKALVIACNTATAYGKDDIEAFVEKAGLDMKVIGVIGAGVRGALGKVSKDADASIGVFATFGTVSSNGYLNEIVSTTQKTSYSGNIEVFQQAGIGLAGAVDGAPEYIDIKADSPRDIYKGPSASHSDALLDTSILARYNFDWSDNNMLFDGNVDNPQNIQINSIDNYISYHVVSLMEQLIVKENAPPLKSIILGCTHFPFYTEQFRNKLNELYNYKENGKYIYRHVMTEQIDIIDPAENTAKELYEYLNAENLFNQADLSESEFFISVANPDNPSNIIENSGSFSYDYKYGRDAGIIQQYVKRVPFSKTNLSEETINMLSNKIPFTYKLIKDFNEKGKSASGLKPEEKL